MALLGTLWNSVRRPGKESRSQSVLPALRLDGLDDNAALFYMHIPKTGGESIRHFLCSLFHSDEQLIVRSVRGILDVEADRVERSRLVLGHLSYDVLALLPDSARMAVTLREPLSRISSHFRHFLSRSGSHLHEFVEREKISTLKAFLQRPESDTVTTNYLCNWLSRDVGLPDAYQASQGRLPHRARGEAKVALRHLDDDEASFELAMARLESMDFVGVTDDFPDLLQGFADHYGLPRPPAPESMRINISRHSAGRSGDLDDETRERLTERNRHDLALYAYAQERYREIRAAHSAAETRRAEEAFRRVTLPTGWAQGGFLDIRGPIGVGWSPVKGEQKGSAFRWSGPGKTSLLMLPLPPGSASNVILTVAERYVGVSERLRVEVNDVPVDVDRKASRHYGKHFDLEFHVPEAAAAQGPWPARCVLQIDKDFDPGEEPAVGGSYGRNHLGLHVVEILPKA